MLEHLHTHSHAAGAARPRQAGMIATDPTHQQTLAGLQLSWHLLLETLSAQDCKQAGTPSQLPCAHQGSAWDR